MISIHFLNPFLSEAQLLKRRKEENDSFCEDTPSSSTTSLVMGEESDQVDKNDALVTHGIHTNTPVDERCPNGQLKNMPIELQDPIFTAAMAHLRQEAESTSWDEA